MLGHLLTVVLGLPGTQVVEWPKGDELEDMGTVNPKP